MSAWLNTLAKPQVLRVSLLATVLLAVALSVCNNWLAPGLKPGMLSLELAFTPERALVMLTAWGEFGRRLFLQSIVLDYFFPLAYGCWLSGLITQASGHLPKVRFLPILPLIAAVSDGLENLCQIVTVGQYPVFNSGVVATTTGFALVKFLLLFVSVLGLWWLKREERAR